MKLTHTLVAAMILTSGTFAADFIPYKKVTTSLLEKNEKAGLRATTEEVKKAFKRKRYCSGRCTHTLGVGRGTHKRFFPCW